MKQLLSLVLAGVSGGLIVLAGLFWLNPSISGNEQATGYAAPVHFTNSAPRLSAVPFDFTEAARRSTPAVVHISSAADRTASRNDNEDNPFRFFFGDELFSPFGDRSPRQGTGSGVIYTSDGYIITNNHVVEFADKIEVTLSDNRKFQARRIGTYPKSDLAVIKIEAQNLPTLEIADSDQAEVGNWVLAVGNPFDLTSTVTAGIISAKGRNIELLDGRDAIEAFIQTDAAVNPGNSGGALVDAEGRLLGINTAIATSTGRFAGYSFAIPVNLVTRIADDIINFGDFQRAFLGVNISELDGEYADELGVDITQGVVIEELIDGGSAQYAGLLEKDIIVEVNGREIKGVPELQEIIGRAKVGDVINVTVNRRGKRLQIPVKLKGA